MMECGQVESAKFCEEVGIAARPVGPSIYHDRMVHLP